MELDEISKLPLEEAEVSEQPLEEISGEVLGWKEPMVVLWIAGRGSVLRTDPHGNPIRNRDVADVSKGDANVR